MRIIQKLQFKNFLSSTLINKKYKVKIIPIIKFFLIIGLFYYLFKTEYIDIKNLIKINFIENFFIIILIILIISFTYFLGALRWWLILKSFDYKLNFLYILKITYIGSFFNNVLFGSYGGDLVKGYYIYKSTNNSVKPAFTIIIDRLFGLIGLTVVGLISFIIFTNGEFLKYFIINYNLLANLILGIFLLSAILIIFLLYKNSLIKKFNLVIIYFNNLLLITKKNFFISLICIFLSTVIFTSVHIGTFFISDIIYDFKIGVEKIFLINFFTTITNALPITPGGLGLGELAFIKANNFFSENQKHITEIANVVILYRVFNVVTSIPGIVLYILNIKKK
jgi:uncharacterized protein (TIRG00374 family)